VARIITFGKMKARAVVRDAGRVMGMPYGEVDKLAKMLPEGPKVTLDGALASEPLLQVIAEKDPRAAELFSIARRLEGLSRHASTHAAGIVISSRPLTDTTPLYRDPKTEVVSTQFSMEPVEKLGLIKFDFLGLKTLTVIRKAIDLVRENHGIEVNMNEVSLEDPETYELLSRGQTDGIFQLESSGMKELLKGLRPEKLEEIIALVALYRPGPMQMISEYTERKLGRAKIRYPHPALKEILEETYGVIVYQEQVMQIATRIAGYRMSEADVLRRAMSKKKKDRMAEEREHFLEGASKQNIIRSKAEEIFELIERFAEYGFNKSHSAAYAIVAYQTAYLKAHYPVEYMAALLTSEKDRTDKLMRYIHCCREMQIPVDPPDINESSSDFLARHNRIRFGLGAIKNIGESALDVIWAAREAGGPFQSLFDFCCRVDLKKVNRRVIESLIKAGAFDLLSQGWRASLMSRLDEAIERGSRAQEEKASAQGSLFDIGLAEKDGGWEAVPPGDEEVQEWTAQERLTFEKEALGFYLTGHPLREYESELRGCGVASIGNLLEMGGDSEVTVGGFITSRKEITTKKGDRMAFLTLEDEGGSLEIILFPEVYRQGVKLLTEAEPMIVKGKLEVGEEEEGEEEDEGEKRRFEARRRGAKVHASKVIPLREYRLASQPALHFSLDSHEATREKLEELRDILLDYRGSCLTFLHLKDSDEGEVTLQMSAEYAVSPCSELVTKIEKLFGRNILRL